LDTPPPPLHLGIDILKHDEESGTRGGLLFLEQTRNKGGKRGGEEMLTIYPCTYFLPQMKNLFIYL
jgi:hypothetical protein